MSNQQPSIRPADDGTLAGVLKTAINKAMQSFDVMMPAEVVAYDRATNRATIKHVIKMVGANGEEVERAQISSVRVYQFGNGGFSMSLPIKPGDKGWIKAADRDISAFQQDLKAGAPNTARMHSFQDGMFMPDAMTQGDAPAGQGDKVVIGSVDGSAFLSFDGNGFTFSVGGNTLELSAAGLFMNGKNIGDTHTHKGVTTGTDNSGPPNP